MPRNDLTDLERQARSRLLEARSILGRVQTAMEIGAPHRVLRSMISEASLLLDQARVDLRDNRPIVGLRGAAE